jgi:hypothetical protein
MRGSRKRSATPGRLTRRLPTTRAASLPALLATLPALLVSLSLAGSASGSAAVPEAHAAGSVQVDDVAHLHLVKSSGSLLIEQGQATGSLPGKATVRMRVGSRVTATFTIVASGGSIAGSGSAALKSSGLYASFGGSLSVGSGSGRYAHAHGKGGLYGVIDRRTHAVTVKTAGTLYY